MILDNERQRELLLGLIAAATVPGAALKDAYALLLALEAAAVADKRQSGDRE